MDGAQAPAGFNPETLAQIAPALQSIIDQGTLSGAVTLVWRGGEVVQSLAIGQRDIEGGLPMTRDTLFRIASMTKPVTSIAVMMLVEEGKLKLTDPVTKWLPELADMHVLDDATGPLDATAPALRDITVEDLMTHRAGLAYAFTSSGPIAHAHHDKLGSPLVNPMTPDEWLKALASCRSATSPAIASTTATPQRCWASWWPASRASRWARC